MGRRFCDSPNRFFSSNPEWTSAPYCNIELTDEQLLHQGPHRNDFTLFWDTTLNIPGTEGQCYMPLIQKLYPLRGYERVRLTSRLEVAVPVELIELIRDGKRLRSNQNLAIELIPLGYFSDLVHVFNPLARESAA